MARAVLRPNRTARRRSLPKDDGDLVVEVEVVGEQDVGGLEKS